MNEKDGYACLRSRDSFHCPWIVALRKKRPYLEFSGLHLTAFGLNMKNTSYLSVFSPNAGKCGTEKLRIGILLRNFNCESFIILQNFF